MLKLESIESSIFEELSNSIIYFQYGINIISTGLNQEGKPIKCPIDAIGTIKNDDKTEFVNREEHMKECLEKRNGFIGLGVSNLAALEIVDDKFRIIVSGDTGFAEKCYFDENGNYIRKKLEIKEEYTDLNELIEK